MFRNHTINCFQSNQEIKISAEIRLYLTRKQDLWNCDVCYNCMSLEVLIISRFNFYCHCCGTCVQCVLFCVFGAHQIIVESYIICCISVVWVIYSVLKHYSAFRTSGTDLPVAHSCPRRLESSFILLWEHKILHCDMWLCFQLNQPVRCSNFSSLLLVI
jgi:hypothetical protein